MKNEDTIKYTQKQVDEFLQKQEEHFEKQKEHMNKVMLEESKKQKLEERELIKRLRPKWDLDLLEAEIEQLKTI